MVVCGRGGAGQHIKEGWREGGFKIASIFIFHNNRPQIFGKYLRAIFLEEEAQTRIQFSIQMGLRTLHRADNGHWSLDIVHPGRTINLAEARQICTMITTFAIGYARSSWRIIFIAFFDGQIYFFIPCTCAGNGCDGGKNIYLAE